MNTRLKQFIAAENISQSQFADAIKVVRASVSHVLSGRNKPGYDFITAIMNAYPNLNMEWLMLGKGKMYKTQDLSSGESATEKTGFDTAEVSVGAGHIGTGLNDGDDLPLLFDYDDDIIPMPSQQTPFVAPASDPPQPAQIHTNAQFSPSAPATNSMTALDSTMQTAVKQRNAVKIIVFYDDGTFQEMYSRR